MIAAFYPIIYDFQTDQLPSDYRYRLTIFLVEENLPSPFVVPFLESKIEGRDQMISFISKRRWVARWLPSSGGIFFVENIQDYRNSVGRWIHYHVLSHRGQIGASDFCSIWTLAQQNNSFSCSIQFIDYHGTQHVN